MIERPAASAEKREFVEKIASAIVAWQDSVQAFDEAVGNRLALNSAERRCIGLLVEGPQISRAIADRVGLTPAAVTSLVDRLEARGFVERRRSAQDRRRVEIALTDAARAETERYYGPTAVEGFELLGRMSVNDLRTVESFLTSVLEIQECNRRRLGTIGETATQGLLLSR